VITIAIFSSTPSPRLFDVVGTALVLFAIKTGCVQVDQSPGNPGSLHAHQRPSVPAWFWIG
jgi:hypothetical protein